MNSILGFTGLFLNKNNFQFGLRLNLTLKLSIGKFSCPEFKSKILIFYKIDQKFGEGNVFSPSKMPKTTCEV